ncbi:MAG: hypothetical protein NTW12_10095 [Deltaproteobacteria bacterium]|nr:hypothetical protein [Deltaproteobacteria bacterium]
MINDVFYTRYNHPLFYGGNIPPQVQILFTQAGHIIFEDICKGYKIPIDIFTKSHKKLAREIGLVSLGPGSTDDEICGLLIFERYNLWNDRHGEGDYFIKLRISLIELIFRELESFAESMQTQKKGLFSPTNIAAYTSLSAALSSAISELNSRFRTCGFPLHYHNGYIQFSNDQVIAQEIEEPFWALLKDQKWKNVDIDMKEAIHRRDIKGRDAALYAFKALESTIKIISDEKGFTSGKEKGAASYIDNLVSKSNGRFIDVWEANLLKMLFSELRNPHGHGPGAEEMPQLTQEQETFVIESAMTWVKSLITRK